MVHKSTHLFPFSALVSLMLSALLSALGQGPQSSTSHSTINQNATNMVDQGRSTFRFDTFGDEAWWGSTLGLHQAIEGSQLGGVGPGVSPQTALAVGLRST
jgi:hypothetical protein